MRGCCFQYVSSNHTYALTILEILRDPRPVRDEGAVEMQVMAGMAEMEEDAEEMEEAAEEEEVGAVAMEGVGEDRRAGPRCMVVR